MTQAVNDELVASLDYKLATGNTNYIQSRKSVQFFPSSLSTFTPSTSRVCRIPITPGSDFVDPESIKLAFTFRNTDGSSDMLCGSPDPSCFIERIQLFANGQRVEDISYYGRSCFMYSLLKPSDWWTELHWEGLPVDAGGWALPVQPGQKRDVLMYPHLIGMFNSGKMLPPQLNLVLEIEFADPEMAMRAGVGSSLSYQIENVHLLADQVTLDSALRESFERILLSNRSLIFSFPSLHVQQSSIPAGSTSYNITVARAFTKMLGALVTFNKTGENHVSNFEYPGEAFPNVTAATVMEGQLQLGAMQFPRNSIKSIAEYHHFLAIMSGTFDSKIRNMRLPNYDNTTFVAAFPTERVPKHPTSGLSTRSGDLCRFTFKSMLADRAQNTADIGTNAVAIAALQGQVAALPAAPDLTPYALAADLAAAEGSILANASGLVAVNTSLTQGLATKANQSALDALQVEVNGKSTPASVDLKLANRPTTAAMNSSIASANNATLSSVAATYALKTVVDQLAIDLAARQTAADVDQRVATALLSYLTQTAYQAGQALQDARLDGHDAEILGPSPRQETSATCRSPCNPPSTASWRRSPRWAAPPTWSTPPSGWGT